MVGGGMSCRLPEPLSEQVARKELDGAHVKGGNLVASEPHMVYIACVYGHNVIVDGHGWPISRSQWTGVDCESVRPRLGL